MIKLRELKRKDMETINRWRNNPELIQFLGAPFRYINLEVDEKWFDHYIANRHNTIRCAIISENIKNEILGLVSLTDIDFINHNAKIHIIIGDEKNCGNGFGTLAIKKMISHAFYNMNLKRIELSVLNTNKRAIHVYSKIGFRKEGIKRKTIYKNGKYQNEVIMGLLKKEYEQST